MNRLLALLVFLIAATPLLAGDPKGTPVEHAVIVHFQYGSTNLDRLFTAEDQLEEAINKAGVGELDGHEIAVDGSDGFFYMYGPDADRLLKTIEPVLATVPFMKGAKVTRRYGPPEEGVKETVTTIAR